MRLKELYRFVEGPQVWTVTSADSDEVYNSETYSSITIGRDEIEQKNELSKANINVTVLLDNPMGRRWMNSILDTVVGLTLFSKDVDAGTTNVIWKGRLVSVKPELAAIKLAFESIFTSMRRPGLRGKYQRSCPHVLYGRGCNLDKDDFAVSSVITAVSGATVTATAAALQPDGWYNGGMIQGPDGALRFVLAHVGSTLTLIRSLDSVTEGFANSGYGNGYGLFYGGLAVNIYPGCDRTKETCKNKFNNLDNNGSFPFMPLKNPMAGSSIV
jgi:uncharacterized phage protein (TIGR02218 family)